MVDPITDMLNRIRNAQAVSKTTVSVPFSNLKNEIAQILEREKFIEKIEKKNKKNKKVIEIALRYIKDSDSKEVNQMAPAIVGLRRVSKPGQRIYIGTKEIKRVRDGFGIAIISTSRGLMTNKEARKQRLGGEVLCEIW